MTTCFLAPDPIQSTQFIPGGNTPANGGQLFFYVAGSSTKQTVYKDNAAAVAWTNPIVLDSGGNLPSGGEVWFPQGQTFKVIFAPSNDTDPPASPYWTKDNLAGTNDVSAQTGVEWISGPTPTIVSTTQFTLAGDQTATFTAGRRVKTTNTGGTVYSTITSSSFGANTTTVNVANDGAGVLDSGLSAVSYGLFDPANPSISAPEVNRKGNAIASSGNGTTNIWASSGDYVHITGTNTIWFFSSAPFAGAEKTLIFDSALQINSSAALAIPGNINITTAPNDRGIVRADTVSTYTFIAPPAGKWTSSQVYAGPSTGAASSPAPRALSAFDGATWVLLERQSANSSASIDFSTAAWTAYDELVVTMKEVIPSVHNTILVIRVSEDGGATYKAGATDYSYSIHYTSDGVDSASSAATTYAQIAQNLSTTAALALSGEVRTWNPSGAVNNKFFKTIATYAAAGAATTDVTGAQRFKGDTNAINAIRFMTINTGNIQSGDFALYGLRKS